MDSKVQAVQQVKIASNLIEECDGLYLIWCIHWCCIYVFPSMSLTHIFVGQCLLLASSEQHQAMGQLRINIYMH